METELWRVSFSRLGKLVRNQNDAASGAEKSAKRKRCNAALPPTRRGSKSRASPTEQFARLHKRLRRLSKGGKEIKKRVPRRPEGRGVAPDPPRRSPSKGQKTEKNLESPASPRRENKNRKEMRVRCTAEPEIEKRVCLSMMQLLAAARSLRNYSSTKRKHT